MCMPTCARVCTCVHMCALVCACARVSNKWMHYGFLLTLCTCICYILVKSPDFSHVELFIYVFICMYVALREASDHVI